MVNEHFERKRNAADAREMCSQRVGFAEGFLCQTSEQLRSLLGANEEVARRRVVQKAPARHTRYQFLPERPTPTTLSASTLSFVLSSAACTASNICSLSGLG